MKGFSTSNHILLRRLQDLSHPPLIMGILNVTPDSFYGGSCLFSPEIAIEHGQRRIAEGAQILDVGGESTRPGAQEISVEEEIKRAIPVIQALAASTDVPLSIDTRHAKVAFAALDAGASIVNDISAFSYDSEMIPLLLSRKPLAIAMHMRGTPATMQQQTHYRSLLADCVSELWTRVRTICDRGFPLENILLDPGIGFAKTPAQNLHLLNNLDLFVRLGPPVVAALSRKSFIGAVLNQPEPSERIFGTAAATTIATILGARIIRVHDVQHMQDVVRMAYAIHRPSDWEKMA